MRVKVSAICVVRKGKTVDLNFPMFIVASKGRMIKMFGFDRGCVVSLNLDKEFCSFIGTGQRSYVI